ncbi:helix-turn-helix domain-containing protein [Clostridium sp. FP1]|uniref:helix-turn-helix domain-containing protein n=1 Tax=Clostridium sp. FP1 TaxID=2724076 RepID=UPI0013E95477|nr:helix-turn-helix transcriptional regulator [Clostridium sp. FP1]MBZ9635560.1 helix-turn-helix transcriptional regulator [Clostridium sp. FP1]
MHRIEYWRNKLVISQSELARRAGISQSYISKLEKGTKIPSLPMLYRIATAM